MRRRGFTMIELLVVVIVISLLASIALLKYLDLRATARTAAVTGDVRSITVAALNYFSDTESWPAEVGAGTVPAGLGPYLPGGLAQSLARPEYTLDYDNVDLGSGNVIAVTITTPDPKLRARIIATFATKFPFFQNGSSLSYLIAGPGGIF